VELSLTGVSRLPDDLQVALVRGARRIELAATTGPSNSADEGRVLVTAPCSDTKIPTGRWKVLLGLGHGSPEIAVAQPLITGSVVRRLVSSVVGRARRQ
jgi:hypothetical protein